MKLGQRIKSLRESMSYSQAEFGKLFGYTGQQISNLETEKTPPNDRFINILKEKYGEDFGLPASETVPRKKFSLRPSEGQGFPDNPIPYTQPDEKMLPEDKGGEIRPGSYGIPDLKTTGVSKIIVEISPDEMVLLNSIRQLDSSTQKGIFITVMGQLNILEQEKHIKLDKQKKDFLKSCIRELSRAVSQAE